MKNILAEAKIEEEFPKDFAIYDLPQFLKVLRLHQDPETVSVKIIMSLFEKDVIVHVISLPNPNVIVSPPEKQLNLPSEDITFQINQGHLNQLLQAANTLDLLILLSLVMLVSFVFPFAIRRTTLQMITQS